MLITDTSINDVQEADKCTECKGIGYVLYKKDVRDDPEHYPEWKDFDDEAAAECGFKPIYEFAKPCPKCKGVSAAEKRTRSTDVPKAWRGIYYNSFRWQSYNDDTSEQRKKLDAYLHNYEVFKANNMGLYIYSGTKGTGKTYLASVLLNSICETYKITGAFVQMNDYLERLDKNKQYGTHEYTDKFFSCDLLIIDDWGQAKASETINKAFYKLIDYRINQVKPIIFTSNVLTIPYDERITNRIQSHVIKIKMPEQNLRAEEGKKKLEELYKKVGII